MLDGKLKRALEAYFNEPRLVPDFDAANDERPLYVPLNKLLNRVGGTLDPKVFCVQELAAQGTGHPSSVSIRCGRFRMVRQRWDKSPGKGWLRLSLLPMARG